MNKGRLVDAVYDRHYNNRADAAYAVEAVLDVITRTLADGEPVSVTGFGCLETRQTSERLARNPQSGAPVHVPATVRPVFRPGQNLLDLVAGAKAVPLSGSAIAKAPKGSLKSGAD